MTHAADEWGSLNVDFHSGLPWFAWFAWKPGDRILSSQIQAATRLQLFDQSACMNILWQKTADYILSPSLITGVLS